ncbi:MAG: MFS transporter [Planctomycetota bacterium]|jgi:hypothetical protein
MKMSGIIHQQICQLKWHLVACLALLMVLPFEEAMVNLTTGDGFYSGGGAVFTALFAPLLVGLIACANVQADLNEKRYIFWRSKPGGVKLMMALKFVIGLIAALAVLAGPFIFSIVTSAIYGHMPLDELLEPEIRPLFLTFIIMTIMTYALCFACNVIVRKTARSWLIGMFLACFILALPFILPLDVKHLAGEPFGLLGFYIPTMLAATALAFSFALIAARRDWHLKTSLKGMLCAGGALVFMVMILLASQVANIKVLDDKEIGVSTAPFVLDHAGNKMIYQGHLYVETQDNRISLRGIEPGIMSKDLDPLLISSNVGFDSEGRQVVYGSRNEAHLERRHPEVGRALLKAAGDDVFSFAIFAYFRVDEYPDKKVGTIRKSTYERVYLRSYKFTEKFWTPICELDISDCLTERNDVARMAMRLIDNKLVACVNDSCVVADANDPASLHLIETNLRIPRTRQPFLPPRHREFAIPLIPIKSIPAEEVVKLSIDLNCRFPTGHNLIYKSSVVDIHDGRIGFVNAYDQDIGRFDVIRWDEDKVYCRLTAARSFTPLEVMTEFDYFGPHFVKNGKLYKYGDASLMVFDIRSNRRIRKLGHFVRMKYPIEDVAVLDDGNILLSVWEGLNVPDGTEYHGRKRRLFLLENPG